MVSKQIAVRPRTDRDREIVDFIRDELAKRLGRQVCQVRISEVFRFALAYYYSSLYGKQKTIDEVIEECWHAKLIRR